MRWLLELRHEREGNVENGKEEKLKNVNLFWKLSKIVYD